MQKWVVGVGLDVVVPQPSAAFPPHVAAAMKRMAGNQDLFLAHEVLPFTRYVPDLPRLSAHKDRIVLAGGQDSRAHLPYHPAAWLAERFGTQVVDFPGDHAGYATQPAAFAAKLREVLNTTAR